MKKTILTILVCGVMVLGLTGCGIFEEKSQTFYHFQRQDKLD